MTLAGSLPFLLSGEIPNLTDAVFESAAGITTTGASIVPDPGILSHGILFWRSLTQWIGGMGIIVLSIAILPLLGMGAMQLARAESPGPMPDRLTPRFRETAKRLWLVYLALTLIEVMFLWIGDMTFFEAVNHSLTTLSTGGFSTNAGSLGAFSAYSQWVVIVFMTLAGVSFALHYTVIRRDPMAYLRSVGLRVYLGIVLVAALLMVIGTWGGSVADTIQKRDLHIAHDRDHNRLRYRGFRFVGPGTRHLDPWPDVRRRYGRVYVRFDQNGQAADPVRGFPN